MTMLKILHTEDRVLPNTRVQTLEQLFHMWLISERRLCRRISRIYIYILKLYITAEWAQYFSSRSCRRREGKGTAPQGTQPSAAGHITDSVHSNHKSAHTCVHMCTHLEFDLYFVISYKECINEMQISTYASFLVVKVCEWQMFIFLFTNKNRSSLNHHPLNNLQYRKLVYQGQMLDI